MPGPTFVGVLRRSPEALPPGRFRARPASERDVNIPWQRAEAALDLLSVGALPANFRPLEEARGAARRYWRRLTRRCLECSPSRGGSGGNYSSSRRRRPRGRCHHWPERGRAYKVTYRLLLAYAAKRTRKTPGTPSTSQTSTRAGIRWRNCRAAPRVPRAAAGVTRCRRVFGATELGRSR